MRSSIKLVDHQPFTPLNWNQERSKIIGGTRLLSRYRLLKSEMKTTFSPTYRWIARSAEAQCPTLPSEKCLSLSLPLSFPLFLSFSFSSNNGNVLVVVQSHRLIGLIQSGLQAGSFPRGRRASLLHACRG